MTPRRRRAIAGGLIVGLYGLLTIPMALWPTLGHHWEHVLFLALYCAMALALALEGAELILALAWTPCRLPLAASASDATQTAVLMTVCDDWDANAVAALGPLAEAGHDVFILDDSSHSSTASRAIPCGITVVRRPVRRGAKGGNLNHWLVASGNRYQNAIILDSDSIVPPKAAATMMRAAAHPANRAVAVFQAKTAARVGAGTTMFARLQGLGARPRARVFERVHAHLDILMSFGHNQLLRLAPIRALGGFDEVLTSEDTVLSLRLAELGYRTALVDTWTFESEPDTLGRSIARTTRWARQTVELFSRRWHRVPLRLKLLLCRHLLSYALPLVGLLLLLGSLWAAPASAGATLGFLRATVLWTAGYEIYALALGLVTGVFLAIVVMRTRLARVEGVGWRQWLMGMLLGTGPHVALLLPLAAALLASAAGRRVRFRPTNSAPHGHWSQGWLLTAGTAALTILVWIGVVMHPGALFIGLNLIWIGLFTLAPVSVAVLSFDAPAGRHDAETEPSPCG